MITATFTQVRNNAKRFFDLVENGDTIEIFRKGKPVAILSPHHKKKTLSRWKQASPLTLQEGVSASSLILQDRDDS